MPRILHLGVGNFFRAHVAAYTQDIPNWQITGVSFRSPAIRDGLAAQNYSYTLLIKDAGGVTAKPITCLANMLVAREDPEVVIKAIASVEFDVITLTVTEKGYSLAPDGTLDLDAPEIRTDLNGSQTSVIGLLTRGLSLRTSPITVLSCDNLAGNGRKLERAVRNFAQAAGLTVPDTITFPASMVDRITPATTDDIRTEANDPMAVPTEAFAEWVIQDTFAAAKPNWLGVQWVKDVAPHEARKLRMLNGAHTYLAYAGILAGHTYVHEAIVDPKILQTTQSLMIEAAETLPAAIRPQTQAYAASLIQRFKNPNLAHMLRQIAMDGSQKIPIRILATLQERRGQTSPALNAALDAWIDFVVSETHAGRALDDPLAQELAAACKQPDPRSVVCHLIS